MSRKNRGLGSAARGLVAGVVLAATMISTPTMAQQAEGRRPAAEQKINPPTPKRADTPPILWSYFSLLVILGVVVTANLIPSKRGHQD